VHGGRHNTTRTVSHLAAAVLSAAVATACDPNEAPDFVSPGDRVLYAGQVLELSLDATDPEGGRVRFGARGLPPGSRFDPNPPGEAGARFTWVPLPSDGAAEGRTHPVTFIAQDDEGARREASVSLVVYLDATLPRFTSPAAFALSPGATLDEVVVVRDDDGPHPVVRLVAGPPSLSLEPHPAGARLRFVAPAEPDPAAPGGLYAIVLAAGPPDAAASGTTVKTLHVLVTP
jgi:hypothetical protein